MRATASGVKGGEPILAGAWGCGGHCAGLGRNRTVQWRTSKRGGSASLALCVLGVLLRDGGNAQLWSGLAC